MDAADKQDLELRYNIDAPLARRWLAVAIICLLLSGVAAIVPVIGLVPGIRESIDSLFGRRTLMAHVTFGFTMWPAAFITLLFVMIPRTGERSALLARIGPFVAFAGMAVLIGLWVAANFMDERPLPIVSHYVLVLDHPMWLVALGIFALGCVLSLIDTILIYDRGAHIRVWPFINPAAAGCVRASAFSLLIAIITYLITWYFHPSTAEYLGEKFGEAASALTQDERIEALKSYYTNLFWGGGHVMQFAHIAAMVGVWMFLHKQLFGTESMRWFWACAFITIQILPVLAGPIVAWGYPSDSETYYNFFRHLMQWATWPILSIFIVVSLMEAYKGYDFRNRSKALIFDPRWTGILCTALLTVAGFICGALISVFDKGDTTLVPGHYHMALGAVTGSFMAATYPIMQQLKMPLPTERVSRAAGIQVLLFCLGMFVMGLGLAIAGGYGGHQRKSYGGDGEVPVGGGEVDNMAIIGMSIMGIGGLLCVIAGVMFIVIVYLCWRNGKRGGVGIPLAPPESGVHQYGRSLRGDIKLPTHGNR